MMPAISVLMPTYGQAALLPRAVDTLRRQTLEDWELVIVDDGSPDATAEAVAALPDDPRITLHGLETNAGLGAAANVALERSSAPLVTYLPSDDVLYADHLATLAGLLAGDADAVLAVAAREPAGDDLQLVQLMHRRTGDRWTERSELESDDLERLFVRRLRARGRVVHADRVTCAWTQHPGQRHRAIRETLDGGLNAFRSRYRVHGPLRFAPSDGALTDEVQRYARWHGRPAPPADGLRVLLVGELGFNPDRILALEERGCRLSGRWTPDPLGWMSVGPLPFGHVEEAPVGDWRETVRAVRPDVVYGLLNWRCVPPVHALLAACPGIPLVFHFKEAPHRSLVRGEWPLLAEVLLGATTIILASAEEREWVLAALGGRLDPERALVMDGDLPKREWLAGPPSPRLSHADGEVHTVLAGRSYGFTDDLRRALGDRGLRLHVHQGRSSVPPEDWVRIFSAYDAGWLHPVAARNRGHVHRATWDDLNLPSRLPALLAAGLPLIVPAREPGAIHAAARLAGDLGVAVAYRDVDDLAEQLGDTAAMAARRDRAWAARHTLTFDAHADRLVEILREAAGR